MMDIRRVTVAGLAGAGATVPMTAWMFGGQAVSSHDEVPPKTLVRKTSHRLGIPAGRFSLPTVLASSAAHLGFGAGAGALYAMLAARSSAPRGMAFGVAVWAVSYAGWIPALGLLPPAHRDRPGRSWTMLTAHLVYGAALGGALRRYDQRR